jgi:23S rRNA pseudouridine1911/1915/1917 synthase
MSRGVSTERVEVAAGMSGSRLDRVLATALPLHSRERLKALIIAGDVLLGDAPARDPARKVSTGETYTVTFPAPVPLHNEAQAIPLAVIHEDADLIVIDKPAGLVVHPAVGNHDGTLVNALLHHCAGQLSGIGGVARPGIVHRIDKGTSGLLVAAKTDRAHEGLAAQFAAHSIDRRYRAIVAGRPLPAAGRIDASLGRSSENRQKMAIVSEGRGKRAVTHFSTLSPLRDATLIECRLETGRTHQVRVHLASISHPLLGDPVYGRPRQTHRALLATLRFTRQALHAAHLGFVHPVTGAALSFDSRNPDDFQELLDALAL